jgi:thiamine biosynthesis lipoprotein
MLAMTAVLSACSVERRPVQRLWTTMGTFASIDVPAREAGKLDAYAAQARDIFEDINGSLTVYSADSELARVNLSAGTAPVPVSDDTAAAVRLALHYAEVSGGSFDPTVAPLVRLWGFSGGTPPPELPAAGMIKDALGTVGHAGVKLTPRSADACGGWQVALERRGMSLDLGGIAKGHAVDLCYDRLAAMDAQHVMVNLGGNIRCRGEASPGRPWRIGIRNPFNQSEIVGVVELSDGWSVATSGNYERFVTIGGQRYTHIIDPRTGYPVKGMAAVTVISPSAVEADAMSTACFVMGVSRATALLATLPDCHVLFIEDERPLTLRLTSGFAGFFAPAQAFSSRVRIVASDG